MLRSFSRPYESLHKAPIIDRVDGAIFTTTYFAECMACTFCHDACCSYGADVDQPNVERLLAEGPELEAFVGLPKSEWFRADAAKADADFPGGEHSRTAVRDGKCVFLDRKGRGCKIHSYLLAKGRDYHELKPMVCSLFAVTFDRGLLAVSNELADQSLRCTGPGLTAYQAARGDIGHYFGEECIGELDRFERESLAG